MDGPSSPTRGEASPTVVRRVDDVISSPCDKRHYRGLVLANELQVMLVSDPESEKAAASLDVRVGHMKDPDHLPGLAHFCEHMLFMGTEKYPLENEYSKFLNLHGGSSNAYTSSEHTNFYFDVTSAHLTGALDRFAQFFRQPLFTESATEREVKAVHSEHEKNVASDAWRLRQLQHAMSDPQHDFHKFGTGNRDTLWEIPNQRGIDVRQELLNFHKEWYSSNMMTLCVLGQETLDELEALVVPLFGPVDNKHQSVPIWSEHPFQAPQLQRRLHVVPIKDCRELRVVFPIPDLQPHYKTKPGHYLGHLIGHEGQGSLLSLLKAKGWANALVGGRGQGSRGFGFFEVSAELTEEGLEHTDEIVHLVFQYLTMLKEAGPQEWVFQECQSIDDMLFRFKEKEMAISLVGNVSTNLHYYPMKEALCGDYVLSEWKPNLITSVLNELVPEKVFLAIVSQKFKDIATETEEWYGTKYHVEPIARTNIDQWSKSTNHEQLELPSPNLFIPTDFELAEVDQSQAALPHPLIIKDTPLVRAWFKQDNEFLLPKCCIFIELRTPLAYLDPHNDNLARLFVRLLKDDLVEFTYDAELAGLGYNIGSTKNGITLSFKGYNEKQPVLVEKILDRLANFKVNPDRFALLKESFVRGLSNFKMEQPHQHAVYNNSFILTERMWLIEDLTACVDELTVQALEDFIPRLLSKVHIQALFHGNITESQALSLTDLVETKLREKHNMRPLLKSQMLHYREVKLEKNTSHVFQKTNEYHKSSCIEVYLQCGEVSQRGKMILELLAHLISEPCFDALRTQEQLGYIVWSGSRRVCGVQGLRIIVQSEKHPEFLDSRIEAFLETIPKFLDGLSDEEFDANKVALKEKILEKPKKLAKRSVKFWNEILTQQYNFDRDQLEAKELDQIEKQDIKAFFQSHFAPDSLLRRKLSCHVLSMVEGGAGKSAGEDATEEEVKPWSVINDVVTFKANRPLYPLPPAFQNVEEFIKQPARED